MEKFQYANIMEVQNLKSSNQHGYRRSKNNLKLLESAVKELEMIAGTKPVYNKG